MVAQQAIADFALGIEKRRQPNGNIAGKKMRGDREGDWKNRVSALVIRMQLPLSRFDHETKNYYI
ncbi:MAG: hypothetical protein FD134_1587 [Gallionellaceae bacterium]|nr:MAG: hypothetical protein FD134_1587 [Gallionellaceae bacterium]